MVFIKPLTAVNFAFSRTYFVCYVLCTEYIYDRHGWEGISSGIVLFDQFLQKDATEHVIQCTGVQLLTYLYRKWIPPSVHTGSNTPMTDWQSTD